MKYWFVFGAISGLLILLVETIRHEWTLWSKEGVSAMLLYPLACGWTLCFLWKIVQWPFL